MSEFPPLIQLPGRPANPPYGFTPVNQAQYDYVTASEPNVFLLGNRGGGKSVTARWTCHAQALTYPGYRYAILRTSFPELIKNHLIYLGEEMAALGGTYNASKFIARYSNGSLGFFMQCSNEREARNALGVEMHSVTFDEAATFALSDMMMISSSVRVPAGSGLVPLKRFNGNPIGPSINELWKYFVDKDVDPYDDPGYRPDEWRVIHISHEDNPTLDVETYRRQLGVGLPEHMRKAWLDGVKMDYGQAFDVEQTRDGKPYHYIYELPTIQGVPFIRHAEG